MRASIAGVILAATLLLTGTAQARGVHFIGGHPISARHGGGYCYIDAPHMHAYPPDRPQLYQKVGDDFVFAADPTPFGYDGEKHPYYGNHPMLTVGGEPVFCYMDGPHFHPFPAPDVPDYKIEKGVAFYVGTPPPAYIKLKPMRRKVVNAEYRPYVAMRPVVEVAPPPEWQGEVWVAPPAVAVTAPGVAVSAPGVVVAPPSVSVSAPGVVVGAPGVVVGAPGFVATAPGVVVSGPRVQVAAPGVYVAPPRGHVAVSAPGVVVAPPAVGGTVYVEGHGHHDNGRHKGWGHH